MNCLRKFLPTRRLDWVLLAVLFLMGGTQIVLAQSHDSALSDGEVEKLRDSAAEPADRVMVFIALLDSRTSRIDKLSSGKRVPGREEDLHELMTDFTSIAEDFGDNLDDYGTRHRDIRKTLPKLIAATERWGTALKTPPEHEEYSLSRKLALEALADIKQAAVALVEEQKAWFLAHPPEKERRVGSGWGLFSARRVQQAIPPYDRPSPGSLVD